jgi:hypothetical protein
MTATRFWPEGAPVIARCPCGGDLMLVEDSDPVRPVEAQCAACGDLTGVAHELVKVTTASPIVPGSPEDFGF